jgi:hypothetical protein
LWLPPRQLPRAPPEGRLFRVKAGKRGGRRREYRLALCPNAPPAVFARAANKDAMRRLDERAATGYFQIIGGRLVSGPLQMNLSHFRVILVDA